MTVVTAPVLAVVIPPSSSLCLLVSYKSLPFHNVCYCPSTKVIRQSNGFHTLVVVVLQQGERGEKCQQWF